MASLRVLAFDHEGRPIQFDTWLDDLQLYLLSDIKDGVSLFDHVSSATTAPPTTADGTTRSQWLSRDAAARLAIRNHLPLAESAHFGQHRTAQALYDDVVARYSSPATAALGRLLLPYLFPDLSSFATVEDLVSHLHTSDARYRATVPAEFLDKNQPPMFITLYFIVTRLPDSLRSVRDHFLSLDPTSLTVDLLEQHLLAAETSAVATSLLLRTSGLLLLVRSAAATRARVARVVEVAARVEAGAVVEVVAEVELVEGVGALVAAVEAANERWRWRQWQRRDWWRWDWIAIFDLDFDAILSAMYALSVSAEGDCYRCVPPDSGIAAAALGASASGTLPGTAPAEALHTFTLDSGATRCFFRDSTTLTPLPAPVLVRLADPSGVPVVVRSSTVLPCPAYRCPPGFDGHYHHSWGSTCVDLHMYMDGSSPGRVHSLARVESVHTGYRVSSGSFVYPGVRVRSGSTPLLVSPPFTPDSFVAPPPGSPLPATPSWHALPSPCLWSTQVCASPPCLPYVEGRQRAAPHSSSFPPATAPVQTLHMDVWAPARVSGQGRERYFLLVVDDYTRYTTVFPLRSKGQVVDVLIPWIRAVRHSPVVHASGLPSAKWDCWRRIGLVMEVARTSMIHAAAPHFLWSFAVWYAAHQLNLWPRVSLPETSPTLRRTGEVGDASVFRVWGFYHPTSRCFFPSQDVTLDESVLLYRLFPYRSNPPPAPPLFLAPGPPPVDPFLPQGPAPSGVSQVDPLPSPVPVQVAVGSGTARGAASGGAEPGGAKSEGAETGGAEPRDATSEGVESGDAEREGAASSGGSAGALLSLSPQQLCEWFVRRARLWSGAPGAGGAGAGGAGVAAGAGVPGGTAATGPGGARTRGTGAARTDGVEGARGVDATESGAAGTGASGAGGAVVGGAGVGGSGAEGAGVGGPGVGGAGAGGAGAFSPGGASPPPLQPASPLPAPSPYTEQSGGLTERREPASRPVSPARTARRIPHLHPPPVPGTHAMTLQSDRARAANPTVSRLLATAVTDPSFESAAASALVAELLDFAAACRLDYTTALVAESASASPPSVGGECALGTDVLEDRQEDFECLVAAVPRLASMLLAPEGDPDAPEIPTPRSYTEAITGPYSSQWQAAMDAEMASWKSTGTYVDEVPPPGANIVDVMWIFRVKRPPGSPPAFKARYVARGFTQRQGVDYFQTLSPTPKMTTLRVLLHVVAQRDYELHSLDFSTTFLQGSLHEEIWLRCPPGFTESFPAGTQWSLRRPVYRLRQVPREWHDTLRTTLAALGFAPATANPSLFLHTVTSLPPFYVLIYVDDLVFATSHTKALTLVKLELQKRQTCTDLGELRSSLGLQITRDRARRTITLTQSHMVHQVLQRFGFQFSSPQPAPLSTGHSLSAPPSDESVEPSGPYPELVGCLMYLMTCTRPDLAYPLSLLVHWEAAKRVLRYLCSTSGMRLVLGGRGPHVLTGHADASWVDDSATQRSSQGYTFSLGSQRGQLRLAYVATRANTADIFTKALPPGDHQRFSTVLGLLALLFLTGLVTTCSPPLCLCGVSNCNQLFASSFILLHSLDTRAVSSCVLSFSDDPDLESDLVLAASPNVTRPLATVVADHSFESAAASSLVAELVNFAAACRLDYATSLVAESESDCPPSVGGECALGTDVFEDRQEDFECLACAVPHLVAMLLAPEGDPDAPDIPTPRSYAEAITVRKTLATLGFAPSTADPSLILRTDTSLSPFYILVYSTPLPTGHSLSAPPSDESVEPSGPYPELVGCLMYLMTCTRPDLAYPLGILARYVVPGRHRPEHWEAAKRVLRYLCNTSGMGLVLGGWVPVVLTGHADVSWELRWLTYVLTDLGVRPRSPPQRGQLCLAYMATRANTADIFTKALQSGDHHRFCTVLGLVPTLPHLLTA
ncbi:unnamed protein product [Closterium sp. NIES-53]